MRLIRRDTNAHIRHCSLKPYRWVQDFARPLFQALRDENTDVKGRVLATLFKSL
jgi:hypothetical protein